ncbi:MULTISPECIES: IS1182 family transposase [unclassified Streptomyces]|uniref:IS1182 family transposase n=1 Tax=Streptomyces sp. NBC_00060 TaxID=2975636 RepID=A0AAU2GTT7_9ACTN
MQGEWAGVPVGPDVWETCRELIPERSVFAFLAEHREVLFPAGMFADMYPSPNGRPSYPPQVLSTVVVLQVLNGLSDAEAVQELRCDLRWKAACGLGLLDGGFDSSLLTYFRRRLQHSRDPHRVFTAVCQVIEATGILRGRHRRALDSTVFQDAVATQDTVTQLISAIRRVAREVPGGTETVKDRCTGHDYLAGPGKPKIAWDDEKARAELADALVTDALQVLAHLPEQNLGEKAANAVGILALVAGQDVEPPEDSDGSDGRWRIARRTAPGRVISTVDPEARHIHKTTHQRTDGFKGHLAFEPETGLFTAVALRPGSGTDHAEGTVALDLLADETGPLDVFGDTAYSGHHHRAALTTAGHQIFCKPAPLKPAVPGGFTLDDFHIDTAAATVTCPVGHTVPLGDQSGQYLQRKAFFGELCTHCPLRDRCTRNKLGRILTIRLHHDQQAAARRQAATDPDWQAAYRRWRPPVERGVAWLVAHGNRRLRYYGTLKNDTWLHTRAAALNLRRLINLGLTHTETTWTIAPATP